MNFFSNWIFERLSISFLQGNEEDFNVHVRKNDLVQNVVGSGPHRKLILANRLSKENPYNSECQSYAIPAATLEFASLCVRNALHLLPLKEEGEMNDGRSTPIFDPASTDTEK